MLDNQETKPVVDEAELQSEADESTHDAVADLLGQESAETSTAAAETDAAEGQLNSEAHAADVVTDTEALAAEGQSNSDTETPETSADKSGQDEPSAPSEDTVDNQEQPGNVVDSPDEGAAASEDLPQQTSTLFQVDQTEAAVESPQTDDTLPSDFAQTDDVTGSDELESAEADDVDSQLDTSQPSVCTIVRFVEKRLTGEEPSGSSELTRAQYDAYCGHLSYTHGITREVADASLHHLDLLPADVVAAIVRGAE